MDTNEDKNYDLKIDLGATELLKKLKAKGLKVTLTVVDGNLSINESKKETFDEFQQRIDEICKTCKPMYSVNDWLEIVDDM